MYIFMKSASYKSQKSLISTLASHLLLSYFCWLFCATTASSCCNFTLKSTSFKVYWSFLQRFPCILKKGPLYLMSTNEIFGEVKPFFSLFQQQNSLKLFNYCFPVLLLQCSMQIWGILLMWQQFSGEGFICILLKHLQPTPLQFLWSRSNF